MSNLDRTLPPACCAPAFVSSQPDVLLWPVQPGRLPLKWSKADAMDTSLSAQSNKPMFGTSDFSVSPVDSSEYIDATAEETCPAESVPMSEQRVASETLSAASLEVMDQLKALAQNVTQDNHASLDESNASSVQSDKSEDISEDKGASGPGESQAPAPSISVFPRPTGFENNPVIIDRPKFGTRALTLAGFAVAALIGAGGTFAWQAHQSSDVATAAVPSPVVPAAHYSTLFGQAAGRVGTRRQLRAPPHGGACRQATAACRCATTA